MKPRLTEKGAKRRGERERAVGLDPEDEAARWLEERDPAAPAGAVEVALQVEGAAPLAPEARR